MNAYQQFVFNTFGFEGAYDLNPHDSGNWTEGVVGKGEMQGTMFGISAASYPDFRAQLPDVLLPASVAHLTKAQAELIYRRCFWDRVHGDQLPPAVALVVADDAFNSGVGAAVKRLQRVFGLVADGRFGPITLEHASKCEDGQKVVLSILLTERILMLAKLNTFGDFGEGWLHRITTLALIAGKYAELDT